MIKLFTVIAFLSTSVLSYAQQWEWMEQIRAVGNDYPTGLTVDDKGSFYVSGRVKSGATFGKGTSQVYIPPIGGETDAYVAKYDKQQNLVWAKTFGGLQPDWGHDLRVDPFGNIYNIGDFCDTAYFDSLRLISPGPSVIGDPFGAARNTYVAKMDSTGKVLWVKRIGGVELHTRGYDIEIDDVGNVYVTGTAQGVVQFDTLTLGVANKNMGFVASFDTNGKLRWVKEFSSQYGCLISDILRVDDKIYVTGSYRYTLNVDGSSFQGENPTWGDFFLSCLSADGLHLFTRTAIGQYSDGGTALSYFDKKLYVAGLFSKVLMFPNDTIYTVVNPTSTVEAHETQNAFVGVYSLDGKIERIWTFGYKKSMTLDDLHVLNRHTLVFSGEYKDTLIFAGNTYTSINGGIDAYVAAYDIKGNEKWFMHGGSTADDHGYQLHPYQNHLLFSGSVYSYGSFGALQAGLAGGYDGVILRIELPATLDFTLNKRDTICASLPDSVTYRAHITGEVDSLRWYINGVEQTQLFMQTAGSIGIASSGAVDIALHGKSTAGWISEIKSDILVYGQPVAVSLPADTVLCLGSSLNIQAAGAFSQMIWNTGETTSEIAVSLPGRYWIRVTSDEICHASDTIEISSTPCVGQEEMDYPYYLSVYPNPVGQRLSISSGDVIQRIELFGPTGQLMLSETPLERKSNLEMINYPSGIYVLKVYLNNCTHISKVIRL